MVKRLNGASVVLILALALSVQAEEQSLPEVLTVRLLPNVSEDTLRYLTQHVELQPTGVKAGASLVEVLRRQNGHYTDSSWSRFKDANPGVDSYLVPSDSEFVFPPEPKYRKRVETDLGSSLDAREVMLREIGLAGPRTRAQLDDLNADRFDIDNIPVGASLKLPYSTGFVSYRLKEESHGQASEIAGRLRAMDPVAVVEASVGWPLHAIKPLNPGELAAHSESCAAEPPAENVWPYDVEALLLQLKEARSRTVVTVAIVDSGLGENEDRLPLWTNTGELETGEDQDYNGYIDDIHGADVPNRGYYPLAPEGPPKMRDHGSHIAGLASGGTRMFETQALRTQVEQRLELMMLKVVEDWDGIIQIQPGAVAEAIAYAVREGAEIVNLSLSQGASAAIRSGIRNTRNVLFVVAAGNKGHDVVAHGIFPANLGGPGSESKNIITVAAHDGKGALACFSNSNSSTVDLAAPGVGLWASVPGSVAEYSGTSQATALVSFTAALLMSRGETSVNRVKQLLVLSADYRSTLEGKVASSGILNIEKALRFDEDLVETTDEGLLGGTLEWRTDDVMVDQRQIETHRIRKLTIIRSETGTRMRVTAWQGQGEEASLRTFQGSVSLQGVTLRTSDGTAHQLSVDKIVDIVKR